MHLADLPRTRPKKQTPKADASFKAEQEKHRREEALANAVAAVPVRLMKRDLLLLTEQLLPLLDEKRQEMAARSRGIKSKAGESAAKLLTAFVRKATKAASASWLSRLSFCFLPEPREMEGRFSA